LRPISTNDGNIIVLDFLSDRYLHTLIKNAFAVVCPSFYEGFGLPLLESMNLGVPVISANNSSLPEVGQDAVLYFDNNNYFDLEDKIKKPHGQCQPQGDCFCPLDCQRFWC